MVEETIVKETDGKPPAKVGADQSNRVFSVEILRLIRDAQKQHGLRHGDYQRYRGMYINFSLKSIKSIKLECMPLLEPARTNKLKIA